MRFLVRSGTERAAAELFSTAETVPGVSPTCSATAFKVTIRSFEPVLFLERLSIRLSLNLCRVANYSGFSPESLIYPSILGSIRADSHAHRQWRMILRDGRQS